MRRCFSIWCCRWCSLPVMWLVLQAALLWSLNKWKSKDLLFLKEIRHPDLRLYKSMPYPIGRHSLWNSACLSNCNHMWNERSREGWMCFLNYIIFWLSIVNYAALWIINLVLCMGALLHFLWHFTMKLVSISNYLKASNSSVSKDRLWWTCVSSSLLSCYCIVTFFNSLQSEWGTLFFPFCTGVRIAKVADSRRSDIQCLM